MQSSVFIIIKLLTLAIVNNKNECNRIGMFVCYENTFFFCFHCLKSPHKYFVHKQTIIINILNVNK